MQVCICKCAISSGIIDALRVEQAKSGWLLELTNFRESAEAKFKCLVRVHKNDLPFAKLFAVENFAMKGFPRTPPRPREAYGGTMVSPDVKVHTAQFATALLDRGVPWETVVDCLSRTDYAPKKRTLEEHVGRVRAGEDILSVKKRGGRPAHLTDEQWDVVAGWILSRSDKVDLDRVQRWITTNFNVTMSIAAISRHKDELGLSVQLTGARPMPAKMLRDEYVIGYFEFVQMLQATGVWERDPSTVICIDSLTNSCRRERETTLGLINGKQQKLSKNLPIYTNNYVVAVGRGLVKGMRALLFTHDPTFDPEGPRRYEVREWCNTFQISRDRIFYTKSNKKYCAEQAIHISSFEAKYRDKLRGTTVIHDGGPAYKIDDAYILAESAAQVIVLPSAQHGELLPLDNKLNAVAKMMWRSERTNKDFSRDALLLLRCIDRVDQGQISGFWTANFLLDKPGVRLQDVVARLAEKDGRPAVRQVDADRYEAAHHAWLDANNETDESPVIDVVEDALDGAYWKLNGDRE